MKDPDIEDGSLSSMQRKEPARSLHTSIRAYLSLKSLFPFVKIIVTGELNSRMTLISVLDLVERGRSLEGGDVAGVDIEFHVSLFPDFAELILPLEELERNSAKSQKRVSSSMSAVYNLMPVTAAICTLR